MNIAEINVVVKTIHQKLLKTKQNKNRLSVSSEIIILLIQDGYFICEIDDIWIQIAFKVQNDKFSTVGKHLLACHLKWFLHSR